jgi:16S rRNA (guanine527-N7)-methyltransferase
MTKDKSSASVFRQTLENEAPSYGVELTGSALDRLVKYYELLNIWNARLHLVAPSPPKNFANRHVLESLLLLEYLPEGARIADIGSGAGLPVLPCLIARPDVYGFLIEASPKKAIFLREALNETATSGQGQVLAERFESIDTPAVGFVTSRAIERFEQVLAEMLSWAPSPSTLLLFGGEDLGDRIEASGFASARKLIPKSQKRFLFIIRKD